MDIFEKLSQDEPTPDYDADTERLEPTAPIEPKPKMVVMVSPSGQRHTVQVGSLVHRLMKDQKYTFGGLA